MFIIKCYCYIEYSMLDEGEYKFDNGRFKNSGKGWNC